MDGLVGVCGIQINTYGVLIQQQTNQLVCCSMLKDLCDCHERNITKLPKIKIKIKIKKKIKVENKELFATKKSMKSICCLDKCFHAVCSGWKKKY